MAPPTVLSCCSGRVRGVGFPRASWRLLTAAVVTLLAAQAEAQQDSESENGAGTEPGLTLASPELQVGLVLQAA